MVYGFVLFCLFYGWLYVVIVVVLGSVLVFGCNINLVMVVCLLISRFLFTDSGLLGFPTVFGLLDFIALVFADLDFSCYVLVLLACPWVVLCVFAC